MVPMTQIIIRGDHQQKVPRAMVPMIPMAHIIMEEDHQLKVSRTMVPMTPMAQIRIIMRQDHQLKVAIKKSRLALEAYLKRHAKMADNAMLGESVVLCIVQK